VRVIGDEEVGSAWYEWPHNRRCVVDYSRSSSAKTRFISFATTDATRVRWVDHPVARVYIEQPDHDEIVEVPVGEGESLATMVDAFATSILTMTPAATSGRSALPLIAAIEQAEMEAQYG
jgi:hypothetical protein